MLRCLSASRNLCAARQLCLFLKTSADSDKPRQHTLLRQRPNGALLGKMEGCQQGLCSICSSISYSNCCIVDFESHDGAAIAFAAGVGCRRNAACTYVCSNYQSAHSTAYRGTSATGTHRSIRSLFSPLESRREPRSAKQGDCSHTQQSNAQKNSQHPAHATCHSEPFVDTTQRANANGDKLAFGSLLSCFST